MFFVTLIDLGYQLVGISLCLILHLLRCNQQRLEHSDDSRHVKLVKLDSQQLQLCWIDFLFKLSQLLLNDLLRIRFHLKRRFASDRRQVFFEQLGAQIVPGEDVQPLGSFFQHDFQVAF